MADINTCAFTGRLGADVEAKQSQDGKAIANFNLAVAGYKKEDTTWLRIVCFGKTAEVARDYLHKGDRAGVVGYLQIRQWENREGQKQWTTEIVCHQLTLLSPKQDGQQSTEQSDHDKAKANGYQREQPQRQTQPATATTSNPGGHDGMPPAGGGEPDEIPFACSWA